MSKIEKVLQQIRTFRDERDWKQFHNPKDMATAISIEASELQELFLWKTPAESTQVAEAKREEVQDEMADIAVYLFELADNLNVNLLEAMEKKIAKNALKYPAHKVRGSSKKYSEYVENKESE